MRVSLGLPIAGHSSSQCKPTLEHSFSYCPTTLVHSFSHGPPTSVFLYLFLITNAKVFFFLLLANNAEAFCFTDQGFWGIFFLPIISNVRDCYILLAIAFCMVCSTLHTHDPYTLRCTLQACHISMHCICDIVQYIHFTPVLRGSNCTLFT